MEKALPVSSGALFFALCPEKNVYNAHKMDYNC